jgi:predicted RNA-binding protein with TRAM domain
MINANDEPKDSDGNCEGRNSPIEDGKLRGVEVLEVGEPHYGMRPGFSGYPAGGGG